MYVERLCKHLYILPVTENVLFMVCQRLVISNFLKQ